MSLKSKVKVLENAVKTAVSINKKLPIEVIDAQIMKRMKTQAAAVRERIRQEYGERDFVKEPERTPEEEAQLREKIKEAAAALTRMVNADVARYSWDG